LDTAGFARGAGGPPRDTLNAGNVNGKNWIPAECDVSIRPGWFYHKAEDSKVKTPEQLFDLYLKSVGRGANLLLNVPPDGRGLITEYDSAALVEFRKLVKNNFKKNLAKNSLVLIDNGHTRFQTTKLTDNNLKTTETIELTGDEEITISFKTKTAINCIVLNEGISLGQKVKSFAILLLGENPKFPAIITGTTIGHKRVFTFKPIQGVKTISIRFAKPQDRPVISEIAAYLIDEKLVEK
jgi:alpha-L-fucosidase